jgi:asparagine synthase (glutamine-hydrolysing)
VAAHLDVPLRELEIGPDLISELERMIYHLDEPQADPSPLLVLRIAEHARADGIKVLLSGAGGDDIFSGYRRHRALQLANLCSVLPKSALRAGAHWARRAEAGDSRLTALAPLSRRLVKLLAQADQTPDMRSIGYFWWSGDQLRRSLYADDLRSAAANAPTAAPLLDSLEQISSERDPLNRMLYLEAKHFLADHNLNYTDKMGMALGVEIRVPLLDLEIVDFATRIPAIGRSVLMPRTPSLHLSVSSFGAGCSLMELPRVTRLNQVL